MIHVHKLHTSALVEYVVERSVRHVMRNDDRVRRGRRLTGPENRQDVRMRKDPAETKTARKCVCECYFTKMKKEHTLKAVFFSDNEMKNEKLQCWKKNSRYSQNLI